MNEDLPALVWLLLATIWGSTLLVLKMGLADLLLVTFAAIRFVAAATPLVAFLVIRGDRCATGAPTRG